MIFVCMLLAAGCYRAGPDGAAPVAPVTSAPGSSVVVTPTTEEIRPPLRTSPAVGKPPAPAPAGSPYQVRYGWGVPASLTRIAHTVDVPIAPPPAPALPYLVEIHAADHPEGSPGYSRFSFYFRGAFPSYQVQYVPRVTQDGSGEPIKLTGNSFLRLQFTPAQAHDGKGRPSIRKAPGSALGFPTLRSYGMAGDYEGYVTYGLGIQVAANSGQVMPIRIGEMIRPDGFHVVAVDVRRG
ncbi:hypothetical protein [Micromonospora sp. NPDC049679]|uniref:AMIN-like domain-containing (lipo)protein n=1 Tax=Micromonospora sp. NPDC049679 TaxID=3155920 RepID=UPI0033EF2575